ncbi:T-cell surface glycoprotein CD1b-like [Echinops telfairi]|uniref:T-cell surface glycoprotein CD1b-like n=1 Tax=Echinops telfairi TaxID=9371 RepID=A0AC55DRC2_ECHTE|nr:T-cell surface glycoprotein CD1b-like [Echinops telfairi]
MLFLLLLLLTVLFQGGDHMDDFQGPTSFYVIQISSFANSTWTKNQGSGWLDDVQIHGWESDSGTAIFLKPWSKGNFSDQDLEVVLDAFRVYFIGFPRELRNYAREFQMEYPLEFQSRVGCELRHGEGPASFFRTALGGLDLLSIQNYSCTPASEGGWRAKKFCAIILQYQGVLEIIEKLLYSYCPRFLLGVLDAGKSDLQRQEKPVAWLSRGPTPGPDRLLLVCRVSGFYPKPVWVTWLRGEQEQPGSRRGDVLPNADGTWYLRVTLDVAAGEAAGLSCRVKHSSLGGQDIVLYWEHPISVGLICLAITVPSLLLFIGLALWFRRHRIIGQSGLNKIVQEELYFQRI